MDHRNRVCSKRVKFGGMRAFALGLLCVAAFAATAPAAAEWAPVADIPAAAVPSVWANGDTIAAGVGTAVYVSTNAGATWHPSTTPVAGVTSIEALWIRNGRLYVGTFGQGVHVSDDLGTTWSPFNQGLVGGFENSQLDLTDLQVRGDSLYAATAGAGLYVRSLQGAGAWHPFGSVFEPNQASNVNGLALGGTRLLAAAGSNGMVFRNDPGEADWTISDLDNVGIRAGLQASSAAWTGTGWVVGTNVGVFRSVAGQEPWTRSGPGLGTLDWTAFATQKGRLFAAFDLPNAAVVAESHDDGATWQDFETQPGAFIQKLAISGSDLYAARRDGLWRRPLTVTSVDLDPALTGLQLAVAGPQPFGDGTSVRFELGRAETISIELFDAHGRRVGDRVEGRWPSGQHEVALNAQRLPSGVYFARLTAGSERQVVRLVHVK